jgi:soluble lytic murein transglycosylase
MSSFRKHQPKSALWWAGCLLAVLVLASGLAWWVGGSRYNPLTVVSSAFGAQSNILYNPMAGLSQPKARVKYAQGLAALKAGDMATATKSFEGLLIVYPGLGDLMRLHLAQAYQTLGREDKVQGHLKTVLKEYPNSPLATLAQYRLGQSYFRGNDPVAAESAFQAVLAKDKASEWGKGSLYYLAQLQQPKQTTTSLATAHRYREQYLLGTPDGTFALEVAKTMEANPHTQWTSALHAAAAKAYLTSQEPTHLGLALAHAQKANFNQSWPTMAETYILLKQPLKASDVLKRALSGHVDAKQAKASMDRLMLLLNTDQKLALLRPLAQLPVCTAQDYVWWQMAQLIPVQSDPYYEKIVTQAADSDFAPESNWQLMWPLIQNRNAVIFNDKAQAHLARYAFSRSAPKVLFWLGKVAEGQRSPQTAIKHYHKLLATYPMDYYAFRAYGRLQELEQGQDDPGWRLQSTESSDYPTEDSSVEPPPLTDILAQATATDAQAPRWSGQLAAVANELAAIGASSDLVMLYKSAFNQPAPAAVLAWHEQASGQKDTSMRTLRNALQERRVPQTSVPVSQWRLLYPLPFAETVEEQAERQGLDPFIVQALMREESYFNPLAVSGSDARGLMQLLPTTAGDVAQWEQLPGFNALQLFVPETNIRLGSRYLAYLYAQLGKNPMAMVGAYNGGPNAMKRWLAEYQTAHPGAAFDPDWFVESIPYNETQQYIKKVFGSYWAYNRLYTPQRFDGLAPLEPSANAMSEEAPAE